MASAATLGQVISVLILPVWARIYPPGVFGVSSLVLAIGTPLASIAALRYDAAIPVAADGETRDVVALSLLATFAMSIASALVVAIAVPLVSASTPMPTWQLLATGAGLTASSGVLAITGQVLSRARDYRGLSTRTLQFNAVSAAVPIALAPVSQGPLSVLCGPILGRLSTGGMLLRIYPSRDLMKARMHDMLVLARRHWRLPALFGTSGLINAFGFQFPLILIGAWYSAAETGAFAMAQRISWLPVTLISASIGGVFYAEVADRIRAGQNNNRRIVLRASGWLAVMGGAWGLSACVLGPAVIPVVLGEDWALAGILIASTALAAALAFIATPLAPVLILRQRGLLALGLDCLRLAVVGVAAYVGHSLFGGIVAVSNCIYTAMAFSYAVGWWACLRVASASSSA